MDRKTVLSRLLLQLEAEVGLLEHLESLAILGRLKSCCQDARILVNESVAPGALLALAQQLVGIASHPHVSSRNTLYRIAASYRLLASQPWQ